jgi:hypothetical protein
MADGRPRGSGKRAGPWGPVKVRRESPLRERSYEVLSREAEERLFRSPEVLSEGSVRPAVGGACWYGSTMITIDLADMAQSFRGPPDAQARERLVQAVAGSVRVRLRAMRLACAEVASRLPDRALGTALVDTRVRVVGDQLYLDVDVEVPVGVSSAQRQR